MQQALDQLGLGPTYHMNDVFRETSHLQRWLDYADHGTADWDALFSGYRSAVDFPAACAWKELYQAYPDAKVVLTVRDPEAWWASITDVLYPRTRTMFPTWLRRVVPFTQGWLDMTDRLVWAGIFDGRILDKEYAMATFDEHIEAVRAACDPERLLVFDVSQGWEPLCAFLGVPVPSGPFPNANDRNALRRRFEAIRWGTRLAPIGLAAAAALALRAAAGRVRSTSA